MPFCSYCNMIEVIREDYLCAACLPKFTEQWKRSSAEIEAGRVYAVRELETGEKALTEAEKNVGWGI